MDEVSGERQAVDRGQYCIDPTWGRRNENPWLQMSKCEQINSKFVNKNYMEFIF